MLQVRPSFALRCIGSLKISEWTPSTSTFELTQGLAYLTTITSFLHHAHHPEWSKHVRTSSAILSLLLPTGLTKKELLKLITFPIIEVQLLALRYLHELLKVIASHRDQRYLLSMTFEIIEENLCDFKSLYNARSRVVEALQQEIQRLTNPPGDGTSPSAVKEANVEELAMDMDLNLDGVAPTPSSSSASKQSKANGKGTNADTTVISVEEKMQQVGSVVNDAIDVWVGILKIVVEQYPSVLSTSKVDWSKVVDDLIFLSTSTRNVSRQRIASIFSNSTISACLTFFSLIIRSSTWYVWFGSEDDNNKLLVNLLMADWQTKAKLSLFGQVLRFAFLGVQNTTDGTCYGALHTFLLHVLRSLGFFEGHEQGQDLTLTVELHAWVRHISHSLTQVREDVSGATDKYFLLFDALLRMALRWRVDAAIACHASTEQLPAEERFPSAPISPLAYLSLCLVVGDLKLFTSFFPGYIRKYWDLLSSGPATTSAVTNDAASGEAKTKDDAIQFFSRFVHGYRQVLADWLLPWLSQLLVQYPQRKEMVRFWTYLCQTKSAASAPVITLVRIEETTVFHLLYSDHSRPSAPSGSRSKHRSFHGLPAQTIKESILPKLHEPMALVHVLCRELPALLAFIRKQPHDAVALCLQSYLDDFEVFIRTQYFLENTSFRKIALDWVRESWQRERLLLASGAPIRVLHISSLLTTLQALQSFINDSVAQYDESQEGIVTSALLGADELLLLLMEMVEFRDASADVLRVQLLNMDSIVRHVKEANAFGMICRRVVIALLSQCRSTSSTSWASRSSSVLILQQATTLFGDLLSVTNIALLDDTYVELLALIVALGPTNTELLQVYFLLRFQVQVHRQKLLAPDQPQPPQEQQQQSPHASHQVLTVRRSTSFVSPSRDLLWAGLRHLSMETLASVSEPVRDALHSSSAPLGANVYALYPSQEHEKEQKMSGLILFAPATLLFPDSNGRPSIVAEVTTTGNQTSRPMPTAVSLSACYERSHVTAAAKQIATLERRLEQVVRTSQALSLSLNAPSATGTTIDSLVTAIHVAVEATVKSCQELHRLAAIDREKDGTDTSQATTTTTTTRMKRHLYGAIRTVQDLVQSLRFAISPDLSPYSSTGQASIATQLQRWFKALLKYQLGDATCLRSVRDMLLWCYHPGLVGRCGKVRPIYASSDGDIDASGGGGSSNSSNSSGHNCSSSNNRGNTIDFHHPINLLELIPRHSSFVVLLARPEAAAAARTELLKLLLTVLQLMTQPTEWSALTDSLRVRVREQVAAVELALVPFYRGTMRRLDRLLLRIFQTIHAVPRLGRSWLQLLPLMTTFAKQQQQQHHHHHFQSHKRAPHSAGNHHSHSHSSCNSNNTTTTTSVLSWLQHAMIQRTLTDFPELRPASPQLFLWECDAFASLSTSSTATATAWSFAPSRFSLRNEEERWRLIRQYQQPTLPTELQLHHQQQQSPPSQDGYGHGYRRLSPAQERYWQREHDRATRQFERWAHEHDLDGQRRRRAMTTMMPQGKHGVYLQDLDCTDLPSLFRHSSSSSSSYPSFSSSNDDEYEDDDDGELGAVYDPAFVVPAFLQCVVQPHLMSHQQPHHHDGDGDVAAASSSDPKSSSNDRVEYGLRELIASGIVSVMLRALSSSCLLLRTYAYCFLDHVWQRLRDGEMQQWRQQQQQLQHQQHHHDEKDAEEEVDHDDDDDDEEDETGHRRESKAITTGGNSASNASNSSNTFREKLLVDVFLRYIKDSIVPEIVAPETSSAATAAPASSSSSSQSKNTMTIALPAKLSSCSAMFFARGMLVLLNPKHEHYALLTKTIVSKPFHAHTELPWLRNVLIQAGLSSSSASSHHNNHANANVAAAALAGRHDDHDDSDRVLERLTALRFLRDSLRIHHPHPPPSSHHHHHSHSHHHVAAAPSFPPTHRLFQQRQVYAQLLAHWALFQHPAHHSEDVRVLLCVLDIFEHALGHADAAAHLLAVPSRAQELTAFLFSQAIVLPVQHHHHHHQPHHHQQQQHSTMLNVLGGSYALRWLHLVRKLTAAASLLHLQAIQHHQQQHHQHHQHHQVSDMHALLESVFVQTWNVCLEQLLLYASQHHPPYPYPDNHSNGNININSNIKHTKHDNYVQFLLAAQRTLQEIAAALERTSTGQLPLPLQAQLVSGMTRWFAAFPTQIAPFLRRDVMSTTATTTTEEDDVLWSWTRLLVHAPTALASALVSTMTSTTATTDDDDVHDDDGAGAVLSSCWRWMLRQSLLRCCGAGRHPPPTTTSTTSATTTDAYDYRHAEEQQGVLVFTYDNNNDNEAANEVEDDDASDEEREDDMDVWQRYARLMHWQARQSISIQMYGPTGDVSSPSSAADVAVECLWRDLQRRRWTYALSSSTDFKHSSLPSSSCFHNNNIIQRDLHTMISLIASIQVELARSAATPSSSHDDASIDLGRRIGAPTSSSLTEELLSVSLCLYRIVRSSAVPHRHHPHRNHPHRNHHHTKDESDPTTTWLSTIVSLASLYVRDDGKKHAAWAPSVDAQLFQPVLERLLHPNNGHHHQNHNHHHNHNSTGHWGDAVIDVIALLLSIQCRRSASPPPQPLQPPSQPNDPELSTFEATRLHALVATATAAIPPPPPRLLDSTAKTPSSTSITATTTTTMTTMAGEVDTNGRATSIPHESRGTNNNNYNNHRTTMTTKKKNNNRKRSAREAELSDVEQAATRRAPRQTKRKWWRTLHSQPF